MSDKDHSNRPEPKEVRVTVHYTMTAREKSFDTKLNEMVRQVIEQAYKKLE